MIHGASKSNKSRWYLGCSLAPRALRHTSSWHGEKGTIMRPVEIETWARRICERVANKQPVEDGRVELKADWPDASKAARRIAGHANASRGETILWLIGVDETKGVAGVVHQEFSNWWAKVRAAFESEVPALQDLNIDIGGKTVVALCFETIRLPFVVKNPAHGKVSGEIEFEVPWREGTAIRTAKRGDLVLMLGPLIKEPKVEILKGEITYYPTQKHPQGLPTFFFNLKTYIVPKTSDALCFPLHNCRASVMANSEVIGDGFRMTIDSERANLERTVQQANTERLVSNMKVPFNELILNQPEMVSIDGKQGFAPRYSGQDELELRISLVEAISELPLVIVGQFKRNIKAGHTNTPNYWELVK